MTTKQLYLLMFLLMGLVLYLDRPTRVQTEVYSSTLSADEVGAATINKSRLNATNQPYGLGIALSGGGIKALCHVGVLKALEEQHIKPDILAGVSAGAVVAALYADGYSPDSIEGLLNTLRLKDLFRFSLPNGGGLFSLNGFKLVLDTLLKAKTFEELQTPLYVIATDLDKGESVVFNRGNLIDALVATCSVPVLFNPYVINGVNYVDGGVLQNLPAFALRKTCHVLIGVNTGPTRADSYDKSLLSIALRSYSFIYRNNTRFAKSICDLVIEPAAINQYSGADVADYKQIFDIGYQETKKLLEDSTLRFTLIKATQKTSR
jgi:NTE family protein